MAVTRKGRKKNELIFFHLKPDKETAEEQQRINVPCRSRRSPASPRCEGVKKRFHGLPQRHRDAFEGSGMRGPSWEL